MAWPNFSESTFAFALLREIEMKYGALSFLPFFFTQPQEAFHGVDAALNLSGTLMLLQFKRSEVMSAAAVEFTSGKFSNYPVFRMHLRRKNNFFQHNILQALEGVGLDVLYAASGAQDVAELNQQFLSATIVNNAGLISPVDIVLPDTITNHHVSFDHVSPYFEVFSERGHRNRRTVVTSVEFEEFVSSRVATAEVNRNKLVSILKFGDEKDVFEPFAGLLQRAATTALMKFDSSIIFIPSS